MNEIKERLNEDLHVLYDRAVNTFPEVEGNLNDKKIAYLTSILDVSEELDVILIEEVFSLIQSLMDVNQLIPQSIIDSLLYCCLKFPQFTVELKRYTKRLNSKAWLFNSIIKIQKNYGDSFQNSIYENKPAWDFILDEFEEDIRVKSTMLDIQISKFPVSLLFESLLFPWQIENKNLHTIEQIVVSMVQFCLQSVNSNTNRILSLLFTIFPNEVYEYVHAWADRLSTECIGKLCELELYNNKPLDGNMFYIAVKMIPFNLELAKNLVSKCNEDEISTFQEIVDHFSEFHGRFIPE